MPKYKIDYTGIQIPNIESIKRTSQQFTNWRRSMGFQTEEEKNALLQSKMQDAQQRFNKQGLWNSEDPYEIYNTYQTDPKKQQDFEQQGVKTAGLLSTIPLTIASAGTMGWIPELATTTAGLVGGLGGYKLGEHIDNKYDTKWATPTLGFIGGMLGGVSGYKGLVNATAKGWNPIRNNASKTLYGKQFIGDVLASGFNKNIKANNAVQQIKLDRNANDRFVQENLIDLKPADSSGIPLDIDTAPRTLVHSDGAATGVTPRKAITIGRSAKSSTDLPHFENGNLVPAKSDITFSDYRTIPSKDHPLFWSDSKPWRETAMNGKMLDEVLDPYYDWSYGGEAINKPYRILTINSDNPSFKVKPGYYPDEFISGPVPMSELKGFEWDPVTKTWSRNLYTDGSIPTTQPSTAPWNVVDIERRKQIERHNAFARKYNEGFGEGLLPYEIVPDDITDEALNEATKNMLRQHNTFYRGVTYSPEIEQLAKSKNISLDEALKIAAHRPKTYNGYTWVSPYLSAGYGGNQGHIPGVSGVARLERPYRLGPDRTKWFDEADFNLGVRTDRGDAEIFNPWIEKPGSTIGSELLGRRFIFRDWVSDYPLLSYGSRKR